MPSVSELWADPPTVTPLDRVRMIMIRLDKDISQYYQKKLIEMSEGMPPARTPKTKTVCDDQIYHQPISSSTSNASTTSGMSGKTRRKRVKKNSSKASLPVKPYIPSLMPPAFSHEKYIRYKTIAYQANRNRKIFTIYGDYGHIRAALLRRGWVEKVPHNYYRDLQSMTVFNLVKYAKSGNNYELVALSKLMESFSTNFIWQGKGFSDGREYALPYRNRIQKSRQFDFTTKDGLAGCSDYKHFYIFNDEKIIVPRSYKLTNWEESNEFLKDYRRTACKSLLQFIYDKWTVKKIADNQTGTVPLSIINFAIDRIKEAIKEKNHEDIDIPLGTRSTPNSADWSNFLFKAVRIINGLEIIKANNIEFKKVIENIQDTLNQWNTHFPLTKLDGYNNIWILKPADFCRGNGIVLMKKYESAMHFSNCRPKLCYIAQKYIERPLLVYKTKFDIRLYMLTVINENINIWLHKDGYLKFSSQEFTLSDLREQFHITNNTVQKRYKNGVRNENLPSHNMWHLSQFQSYLNNISYKNIWSKKILPAIKQIIITIVLASLEGTDLVKNTFELNGCDFMLDEEFNPILLEINATPDMSPSTCVTTKLCPAVLEDVVKVVVDVPIDSKANTGDFELIYQVQCSRVQEYPYNLTLQARKARVFNMTVIKPTPISRKASKQLPITKRSLPFSKPPLPFSKPPLPITKSLPITRKVSKQFPIVRKISKQLPITRKVSKPLSITKKASKQLSIAREEFKALSISTTASKSLMKVPSNSTSWKSFKTTSSSQLNVKNSQVMKRNPNDIICKILTRMDESKSLKNSKGTDTDIRIVDIKSPLSSYNLLRKSVDILNTLQTQSINDRAIREEMKEIVIAPSYSSHSRIGKFSPPITSSRTSEISLKPSVKNFLALKTADVCQGNKKQEKILLDFIDIVLKKANGAY